jgi:hypothetical protein
MKGMGLCWRVGLGGLGRGVSDCGSRSDERLGGGRLGGTRKINRRSGNDDRLRGGRFDVDDTSVGAEKGGRKKER